MWIKLLLCVCVLQLIVCQDNSIKISPDQPIFIRNPNITKLPTAPPSPPDVSNHKNLNLLPTECGRSAIDDRTPNIQDANLLQFPWMALISYYTKRRGSQFKCGGTIINDRYILTAAHCITNLSEPLLGVRLGEYDIRTRIDCQIKYKSKKCTVPVQDLAIEEVIAHPGYDASIITNDIGLLRLTKINLTAENVKPVCLPVEDNTRHAKFNNTIVTGWGYRDNFSTPSYILQSIDLPIVTRQDCQNAYLVDKRAKISEKQICAGGKNKRDSCPGDSGGPMQVPSIVNEDVGYVQQGIASFGPRECGLEGYPWVYTKVAYYMDWILDNMKP